jgi:hypothetical protein
MRSIDNAIQRDTVDRKRTYTPPDPSNSAAGPSNSTSTSTAAAHVGCIQEITLDQTMMMMIWHMDGVDLLRLNMDVRCFNSCNISFMIYII